MSHPVNHTGCVTLRLVSRAALGRPTAGVALLWAEGRRQPVAAERFGTPNKNERPDQRVRSRPWPTSRIIKVNVNVFCVLPKRPLPGTGPDPETYWKSDEERRAFIVGPGRAVSSSRRVPTLNTEIDQPSHDARCVPGRANTATGRLTFPIAAPALGCAGSLARPQNGPTGRSETGWAGLQESRLLLDSERREQSISMVLFPSLAVPFSTAVIKLGRLVHLQGCLRVVVGADMG